MSKLLLIKCRGCSRAFWTDKLKNDRCDYCKSSEIDDQARIAAQWQNIAKEAVE